MRRLFKLIPVSFRQYKYEEGGWYVSEMDTETKQYNPDTEKMENEFSGVAKLEFFLNRGWSIVSIQTAPIPACDSVPGAMISQYLLSIEVPDEDIASKKE